ncbi:MAG: pentapeptide repeat-containing protein [Devosia sp.]|nr:pentapeptide repeat-containing protein [Devosia sp.]
MTKTVMYEPEMRASTVSDAKYEHVLFHCGFFDDSEFTKCVFSSVEFEGGFMNDVIFRKCEFNDTLFYDVYAFRTKFHGSRFSRVQFKGANLAEADFSNCVFVDSCLGADNIGTETDISGACFEGADLTDVTFSNVICDASTIFPRSFDPRARRGLKLI